MNTVTFKIQTCNGNPEVIKVGNGIAKKIIAGEKHCLSMAQAEGLCDLLHTITVSSLPNRNLFIQID